MTRTNRPRLRVRQIDAALRRGVHDAQAPAPDAMPDRIMHEVKLSTARATTSQPIRSRASSLTLRAAAAVVIVATGGMIVFSSIRAPINRPGARQEPVLPSPVETSVRIEAWTQRIDTLGARVRQANLIHHEATRLYDDVRTGFVTMRDRLPTYPGRGLSTEDGS